jgi:hypothetical protein
MWIKIENGELVNLSNSSRIHTQAYTGGVYLQAEFSSGRVILHTYQTQEQAEVALNQLQSVLQAGVFPFPVSDWPNDSLG